MFQGIGEHEYLSREQGNTVKGNKGALFLFQKSFLCTGSQIILHRDLEHVHFCSYHLQFHKFG